MFDVQVEIELDAAQLDFYVCAMRILIEKLIKTQRRRRRHKTKQRIRSYRCRLGSWFVHNARCCAAQASHFDRNFEVIYIMIPTKIAIDA